MTEMCELCNNEATLEGPGGHYCKSCVEKEDELLQCADCGMVLRRDHDDYQFTREDLLCWSCYECEEQYMQTLVYYSPDGEKHKVLFSERLGTIDYEFGDSDNELPEPVKSVGYQKTDGWRGYYFPVLMDGYMTISEGWATGRYDDVPWKHDFNDFVENLHEGELVPPVGIYFIYCMTSNVFSTAVDIVIREEDENTLRTWLNLEVGCGVECLDRALS